MSTAQVTGVVALMLSVEPKLTLGNIRSIFKDTSTDLGDPGWDKLYGYGLINAGMAVRNADNGDYDEYPDDNNSGNDPGNDPPLGDLDGDGFFSIMDGGNDCNDYDPTVYPGAMDIAYDGIDQDCSGSDLTDMDGDGYDSIEVGGTDCDDSDAGIHPGALELENDGIDQDCDGGDNTSTSDVVDPPESCDDMEYECDSCDREDEVELECP